MGKTTGFREYRRGGDDYRAPGLRLGDYCEIYPPADEAKLKLQAARCMDCGVPFCQSDYGCPIDNLIPEWNDLVYRGRWREAFERLRQTNNFPEFTGRVCPAPCEGACVLDIIDDAVTIKKVENTIIERAFAEGWVGPRPPARRSGRRVAVIGSGPAGLAAADLLNQAGHEVTVYEKSDRVGGLLMYGIPNMKLDKSVVRRRVELLAAEGIRFVTNAAVGETVDCGRLKAEYDALLLAVGAGRPRDLEIPGRELGGIHFAMDFLTCSTRRLLDGSSRWEDLDAAEKRVIVIGGGDTGTDCIATALRQGCTQLLNLELMARPPEERDPDNPWPYWPRVYRVEYGHEEARERFGADPRRFSAMTTEFIGRDGRVAGLKTVDVEWEVENGRTRPRPVPESERLWMADMVLLALGFLGPAPELADALGLELDARSNFKAPENRFNTDVPGIFAAGDCRRGQSLVVWAIQEGRGAARAVSRFLAQAGDSISLS